MNSENFLLDAGIWGFVYKILTPIEWLMTWVMWVFHKLFTFIGMPEHGISWALAIIFLVIVVQACVFPLYFKSMKGMRARSRTSTRARTTRLRRKPCSAR